MPMHPPTMAAAVVIRPSEAVTRPHSRRGSIQQSTIRRHTIQQVIIVKTRKNIIIINY